MPMEQGGKLPSLMRRVQGHVTHSPARSNEKEQPPTSHSAAAVPNGSAPDNRSVPRTPMKPPVRSATVDVPATPKPPVQEPHSREEAEQPKATDSQLKRAERAKPVDPQAEEIRRLKERCAHYESQLYHEELLSIRKHLQVNDLQEPWQISREFRAINKEIENISRNLSEDLADTHKPLFPVQTGHILRFLRPGLAQEDLPVPDVPVSAEDLVDFCCRALINEELMKTVFNPECFHPSLDDEPNRLLVDMYKTIREQESQVIAGRWRVSSFNSQRGFSYQSQNKAYDFCRHTLRRLCTEIYGEASAENALNMIFPQIEALFKHAWEWYSSAKSSVVMLDFGPYYIPPGWTFNPDDVTLEGRKPKPPKSGSILLTSRLGLMSSEAQGVGLPPQQSYQVKATVLAAEYFLGDR